MKGLILCAGKGTRLQPFSFSQPKTLLPVANKPVLEYCIENLVRQGIQDIGIVINAAQDSIPQKIGTGERFGARIHYIYQTEQKGISHAVKESSGFINQEPFILLLGDNLIAEDLKTLVASYHLNKSKGSILLAPVENPQDFGIAEIAEDQIICLEEKPQKPKSNLAVIGAYLFDPVVFEAVQQISPSARGEYEITDAIQWMLLQGHKISYTITGKLYSDVGTVHRWLEANQWMLSKQMGEKIKLGANTVIENCTLHGPLVVGDHCLLRNVEVGPFVSIDNHCTIEGCSISHSILLKGSIIRNMKLTISESVIGRETSIQGHHGGDPQRIQLIVGDKSRMEIFTDENTENEG